MRLLRVLMTVVVASSVVALATPGTLLAANGIENCGGTAPLNERFAGQSHPGFTTGIYAHLDPQLLHLCLNPPAGTRRASISSVGIEYVGPVICADCIIQIARGTCHDPIVNPVDCSNNGQRVYTAWGRNNDVPGCEGKSNVIATPKDRGPAPQDNGYHYYRVALSGLSYLFDHWPKGGTLVTEWTLLASEVCWIGNSGGTSFVEHWDRGDALGGSDANHYQVLHLTGRGSGGWTATTLNPNNACTMDPGGFLNPYHCDITGSQAWEAWTSR